MKRPRLSCYRVTGADGKAEFYAQGENAWARLDPFDSVRWKEGELPAPVTTSGHPVTTAEIENAFGLKLGVRCRCYSTSHPVRAIAIGFVVWAIVPALISVAYLIESSPVLAFIALATLYLAAPLGVLVYIRSLGVWDKHTAVTKSAQFTVLIPLIPFIVGFTFAGALDPESPKLIVRLVLALMIAVVGSGFSLATAALSLPAAKVTTVEDH